MLKFWANVLVKSLIELFKDYQFMCSYNIAFLLLTYILPMATMAIAYSLMGRVLWGSQGIGEGNANSIQQQGIIRSKQKVVRMLICGQYW